MKWLLSAALVLAFGFLSEAQQSTSAQEEIITLEQQLTDAGNHGDVSAAEKYLVPNSIVANRQQALDAIRKRQQQNTIRNIKVRLLGTGAVATYESAVWDSNPRTGASETRKLIENDFWGKRNGRWLLLASQGSAAEPLPAEMWQQSAPMNER